MKAYSFWITLALLFLFPFSGSSQTIYSLQFKTTEGGAISGVKSQTVPGDSSSSPVTADPDYNFKFSYWMKNDSTILSLSNPLIIDSVKEDMVIIAIFSPVSNYPIYIEDSISLPPPLQINEFKDTVSTREGSLTIGNEIKISGGTPDYIIHWFDSTGDIISSQLIANVTIQKNTKLILTVSDKNNCSLTDTLFISFSNATAIPITTFSRISVWPNPGRNFNIQFPNGIYGTVKIQLFDLSGKLITNRNYTLFGNKETFQFKTSIPEGVYILKISGNKVYAETKIIVKH